MIWTLALMLWQIATPLAPKQYHFRQTRPIIRPAIVNPLAPNRFVQGDSPKGKCSIPLVNAPGFQIWEGTRSMRTLNPGRDVDPKMNSAPLAPPCENWFGK